MSRTKCMTKVKKIVAFAGGTIKELSQKETWSQLQAWREIYCASVFEATGKWIYPDQGGYSWHTFSNEFFPSLRGSKAVLNYSQQSTSDLLVLPESEQELGFRCTSKTPVDFSHLYIDTYIAPPSFEWTMAFTHEAPTYGPYFSRSEWRQKIHIT